MGSRLNDEIYWATLEQSDWRFCNALKQIKLSEFVGAAISQVPIIEDGLYAFRCPFCKNDDTLYVKDDTGKFCTAECRTEGKLYDFIMKYYHKSKEETTTMIKGKATARPPRQPSEIKIGIITALPHEFAAMKALMEKTEDMSFHNGFDTAGNRYIVGNIDSLVDDGTHRVALALLPKMGNNFAAVVATKMQNNFPHIEHLIVSGIVGGIPNKTRLGDVVISVDGILQYDLGSQQTDDFIIKSSPQPCGAYLLEAVRFLTASSLETGDTWISYVDDIVSSMKGADFSRPTVNEIYWEKLDGEYKELERPPSSKTKALLSRIASGNAVMKDYLSRDALCNKYGIIAFEMEGSGVMDSTAMESNGCLVIRGVCDYSDARKNDIWQNYAAAVAASYTRALIESLPTKIGNNVKT